LVVEEKLQLNRITWFQAS